MSIYTIKYKSNKDVSDIGTIKLYIISSAILLGSVFLASLFS